MFNLGEFSMKKTLIALAVLAASSAAMAQSSVTLYGRLDAGLGQTKTTVNGVDLGSKQTGINSSTLNTTYWGLKGSEDLGGGLRANFDLQSGFAIDTGAGNPGLFQRKAIVGLSGAFGSVDLGRNYTAYDALRSATNNTFDSNLATTAAVWGNGIADYSLRTSNSVIYNSPNFSGFSGAVAYGFGENKTATNDATDTLSLHVKYANGPLLVGYGYQEEKQLAVAGIQDKNKYNLIGATYDLGMVKLVGAYNTVKNNTLKDKEYEIGVSAPFGAANVAAGYTNSKSEGFNTTNKGTGYSLVGTYDLSKRTTLYVGYNQAKTQTANGSIEQKNTVVATGVRHTF
jgi:predicted porin